MRIIKRDDGWWIIDVPSSLAGGERFTSCGPYATKAAAADDQLGLERFYDEHPVCEAQLPGFPPVPPTISRDRSLHWFVRSLKFKPVRLGKAEAVELLPRPADAARFRAGLKPAFSTQAFVKLCFKPPGSTSRIHRECLRTNQCLSNLRQRHLACRCGFSNPRHSAFHVLSGFAIATWSRCVVLLMPREASDGRVWHRNCTACCDGIFVPNLLAAPSV
jgi:hypothetical protein